MAPFNINAVAFIPGQDYSFGSLNFVASIDGRLHISNLEVIRSGQIRSDSASSNATHSSSELDSARLVSSSSALLLIHPSPSSSGSSPRPSALYLPWVDIHHPGG